jgi:hypothetical protein
MSKPTLVIPSNLIYYGLNLQSRKFDKMYEVDSSDIS